MFEPNNNIYYKKETKDIQYKQNNIINDKVSTLEYTYI